MSFSLRPAYRLLSILNLARSASRGPKSLARTVVRREAHKTTARAMRKVGL